MFKFLRIFWGRLEVLSFGILKIDTERHRKKKVKIAWGTHHNAIRVDDCIQSMSDGEHRRVDETPFDCRLNQTVCPANDTQVITTVINHRSIIEQRWARGDGGISPKGPDPSMETFFTMGHPPDGAEKSSLN